MATTSEHAGSAETARPGTSLTRRDGIALCLIVLLGLALRVYRVNAQSVWYDEAFTVAHSVKPLGELFQVLLREGGRHPPLHYWLLHVWFGIVGFGAVEARLVSVICGTLSMPLLYVLARRFTDAATSLCAALLLSVSQIAIYFSQEARAYMAAQCLSLLAACAFTSLLKRPTFARTAVFGTVSLALLATHYYGIATLAALGLYWVAFRRDYSPVVFRRLVIAAGVTAAVYAPWPLALRSSAEAQPGQVFQERDSSERPGLLSPVMAVNRFNNGKLASVETESPAWSVALGLGIFTLPLAAALWLGGTRRDARSAVEASPLGAARTGSPDAPRRRLQGLVLGCLLAAVPVGVAMLAGALGATFNYRHFSFAVPGYYLAVAIGWQVCFRRPSLRAAWLVAALALSAFALRANYFAPTKPDYRAALAPLAAGYQAGDCAVNRPGIWHDSMHLAWEVYYRDRGSPTTVAFDSLPAGLAGCERLWFVWDTTWWMNHDAEERARTTAMEAELRADFDLLEEGHHPAVDLRLFRRRRSH